MSRGGRKSGRGWLKEREKVASFAQQLPPETFADYVSAGEQGERAEGGSAATRPRPLDNAAIVGPESRSFCMNGARAS